MCQSTGIACDLTAIPASHRESHLQGVQELFAATQTLQEVADGYRFLFPADHLLQVAQWINHERLCCPFYHFQIDLEPSSETQDAALWVALRGNAEVKALTREVFSDLTGAVTQKLIQTGEDALLTAQVEQTASVLSQALDAKLNALK